MPLKDWLTSSRAKSLSTIIAAAAAAIAVVVTAVRPQPASAAKTAEGYEILRKEIERQQDEIIQLHKSVASLEAWLQVLYKRERMRDLEKSMAVLPPSAKKQILDKDVDGVLDQKEIVSLPPPPKAPPVSSVRKIPVAKSVF